MNYLQNQLKLFQLNKYAEQNKFTSQIKQIYIVCSYKCQLFKVLYCVYRLFPNIWTAKPCTLGYKGILKLIVEKRVETQPVCFPFTHHYLLSLSFSQMWEINRIKLIHGVNYVTFNTCLFIYIFVVVVYWRQNYLLLTRHIKVVSCRYCCSARLTWRRFFR